uniref:toll/interleukin-1 receptor domain-containing protein n=1 Tax=Paractinoplanes polyasparticus TaxID=2856853 RepID=UPI001C862AEF|nr:toll/interleukin-1 receptor domain-containing protein [Actinoplanes polyasparticus]
MSPDTATDYRYDAFMSYSHAVNGELARTLQGSLERFATAWYRPRSLRVFRDYTSLSAGHNLTKSIIAALESSRYFVLLASPEAASSEWVNREVAWWDENRSPDHVIIALTKGVLHWSDGLKGWDRALTTALPPAALKMFDAEPLWVDVRSLTTTGRLDAANPDLLQNVAKIAAPVRGVDLDLLVGEHITLHRRARRQRAGAVIALCVLLVLVVVAAVIAVSQRRTALDQARIASARALASAAVANLDSQLDLAQLLAAEAYRLDPVPQTQAGLLRAMTASPSLVRYLHAGAEVTRVAGSRDGKIVVAGTADGRVMRWPFTGARAQQLADLPGEIRSLSLSADGGTVVAADQSRAVAWAADSGIHDITVPPGHSDPVVAATPSGTTAIVHSVVADTFEPPGRLTMIDLDRGTTRSVDTTDTGGWNEIMAPTDQQLVLFDSGYGNWERRTLPTLTRSAIGSAGFGVQNSAAAISPDGSLVTYTNGADWLPIWQTRALSAATTDHHREAASVGRFPTALALSRDGKRAATASNGTIYVSAVVAAGGTRRAPLALTGNASINPDTLAFLGDSSHLISGAGSSVALWDTNQLNRIAKRTTTSVLSPCTGCAPVTITANHDATAVVVSAEAGDGLRIHRFDGVPGTPSAPITTGGGVAWTPDNRLLVRGSPADLPLPAPAVAFPVDSGVSRTKAVRVTDDGTRLVVVDATNTIEVHDTRTGELLRRIDTLPEGDPEIDPGGGIGAISADGTRAAVITTDGVAVATIDTDDVRIIAARSPQERATDSYLAANSITFVGDKLAVQRQTTNVVNLWDVDAGRIVRTVANDPDTLSVFAISNQDELFVQHRGDDTVVVKDSRTGTTIGSLDLSPPESGLATSIAFSGNGKAMVAAIGSNLDTDFPGQLQRWQLSPAEWMRQACETANRSLAVSEWREHAGTEAPASLECTREFPPLSWSFSNMID